MRKARKKTAIADRLNHVRQLVGATDLKAFYASLEGEKVRGFPSYPAVCTYHGKPFRDPPTVYLARIAEQYPQVNVAWLVTGAGSPMREAERRNPILDVFRELPGAGTAGGPDPAAEGVLYRLLAPLIVARGELAQLHGQNVPDDEALQLECARLIVRALRAPLEVLGLPPNPARQVRMIVGPAVDDYTIGVAEALRVYVQSQANWIRHLRINLQPEGF